MPQPLRNLEGLKIGPKLILERPKLAAQIGLVAVQWNLVEWSFSGLLQSLIEGNEAQSLSMYLAIHSDSGRQSLIRAAAAHSLDENLMQRLEDLLQEARGRALERNKIVHGVWGTVPHQPDALVWTDTKDLMNSKGGGLLLLFSEEHDATSLKGTLPVFREWLENESPRYLVYSEKDIVGIVERISSLSRAVIDFQSVVGRHRAAPPPILLRGNETAAE